MVVRSSCRLSETLGQTSQLSAPLRNFLLVMTAILILNVSPGELRGIVATVMMMIIRTRTELAPMITFILWFWIILMTVSEVDGEGGDWLTPEVSSADILLVRSSVATFGASDQSINTSKTGVFTVQVILMIAVTLNKCDPNKET